MKRLTVQIALVALIGLGAGAGMHSLQAQGKWDGKFEQLGTTLPTPNTYRTASGAPGKDYWQQQADYEIAVVLNDENQSINGEEKITYYNRSPDDLRYVWVQLDQNIRSRGSDTPLIRATRLRDSISTRYLQAVSGLGTDYDGGFKISYVRDAAGKALRYLVQKTMMRVELPTVLASGGTFSFQIAWSYAINDRMQDGGRSGYEYFPADDNYLYTIAQFYPRMAVYDDVEGWQNKQFIGNGEFALSFGDFDVKITVPSDHVVASTGTLQNPNDVLTATQRSRFDQAKNALAKPVIIVTEAEARVAEKQRAKGTKTWHYRAKNIRDFAFASSRKFIWDAMAVELEGGLRPLAMSYYPKEGNPLWEEESTRAVANTLLTYSRHTITYPYPVAISVHTASIGMEYPMICFNWGRPNPDGTYSDQTKWRMIGVIVHEVGHNFFPMIINSDERQWTWMDEGLNTFVEYLTESEHYTDMPSRRGPPRTIVPYMRGDKEFIRPIMVNSEQILQFGNNAYGKPAAALTVLRETVMGRELFDYAFKEYSRRWAFRHPAPADFFRTMEDASGFDLDWFWRGWFYTTDHVDVSIDAVKWYKMKDESATLEGRVSSDVALGGEAGSLSGTPQPLTVMETTRYGEFMNRLEDKEIMSKHQNKHFYEVTFKNEGGLVMPILIEWAYVDGTKEMQKLPAEIWRKNENEVVKVFAKSKQVASLRLDPYEMTADTETENNLYPRAEMPSKVETFKQSQSKDKAKDKAKDKKKKKSRRRG